jgi:hypothetical protein
LQWRGNLKCVKNEKIDAIHDDENKRIIAARWWRDGLSVTRLTWLQDISYNHIDHDLCSAFAERWHKESSSFHLPFGEMTVKLDDVVYLMHLPIDGMLLSHKSISRNDAMEMMIRYLGSSPGDAIEEVNDIRGAHARFWYLRKIFKQRLLQQMNADNEGDIEEEVQKLQGQAIRIYLLYLVGITLFTDKSSHYVDVVYLRYFRDLEVVAGYS